MQDTRTRLKQAALALCLKRGYAGATIAEIEKMAGLAPRAGGFYRHFDSKEALIVAIAREDIIEREEELGFDAFLPLGDTRAELLLIARAYLRANERQRKYFNLIQEVRKIPALARFEETANAQMVDVLKKWVAQKPAAKQLRGAALGAFTLTVFGGLGFYLTKRLQGIKLPGVSDDAMIERWADYWAPALDAEPPGKAVKRYRPN